MYSELVATSIAAARKDKAENMQDDTVPQQEICSVDEVQEDEPLPEKDMNDFELDARSSDEEMLGFLDQQISDALFPDELFRTKAAKCKHRATPQEDKDSTTCSDDSSDSD